MTDRDQATTEIRRLSRLKGYPRAWESAGKIAAEQDDQAEAALIDAAIAAPSVSHLRRFVMEWERRHVEAPLPATLYEAWRGPEVPRYDGAQRRICPDCGGSGWQTRSYVAAAIAERNAPKIYIEESEVAEWWERIRKTPSCAQRVYEEAVRCPCAAAAPRKDVQGDVSARHAMARRAAGDCDE